MDACFNNCESVKVLDLSMFDMSSIVELTQTFEYCYKLEEIIGIETWVTPNLRGIEEMFSHCYTLKELDLSGLDTRNIGRNVPMVNGSTMTGFGSMFYGVNLQKLVLGENFSLVGDGTLTAGQYAVLPKPAAIDGVATKWYNAANDTYYTASEIPGLTAATYIAAVEPAAEG
jgi:surface protein